MSYFNRIYFISLKFVPVYINSVHMSFIHNMKKQLYITISKHQFNK